MNSRPDLDDYECYDPQSMQEYVYKVEQYIDELEDKLKENNNE